MSFFTEQHLYSVRNKPFCSVACHHNHKTTLHRELRESTKFLHAMIELANFTLLPWAMFTPLLTDKVKRLIKTKGNT